MKIKLYSSTCFALEGNFCAAGRRRRATWAGALCGGILLLVTAGTSGAAYTGLAIELSADGQLWNRSLVAAPGTTVAARVVASYDGAAPVYGLAWVNFQPRISGWISQLDRMEDYLTTGNQDGGMVAFDKPGTGQAAYGRIFPFAAVALGESAGGQQTTLMNHAEVVGGRGTIRIAQSRTTNAVGTGTGVGQFAYNNTNGAGGIVCAQPPSEAVFAGVRSSANAGIVLFAFAFTLDATSTDRSLLVSVPIGGVSLFGQPEHSAGWFSSPAQSAAAVTYVPVRTRAAALSVRGPVPTPATGLMALLCLPLARRRVR